MTDRARISARIRGAIAMDGSPAQVAKRSGIALTTLQSYLYDGRLPTADNLLHLCRGLGASPNELLGWEEERGKWVYKQSRGQRHPRCSLCDQESVYEDEFCGSCGAPMDRADTNPWQDGRA